MSKNIKRNTKALQTTYDNYKNRLNQTTRDKIQNLINFYEDRKIAQFTTADNLIRQFITATTDKQKTKANNAYDKIHDKHHDKEPLGERMQKAKEENKRNPKKGTHIYSVDALFYRLKDEKKEQELKTAFKDSKGRPYVILWKDPKTFNVKSSTYIEDLVKKRIFRTEKDTAKVFFKLYETLQTDRDAYDELEFHKSYIDCIKLLSVERVDEETDFAPEKEKLKNTANLSMYNIYIQTPLDPEFETFKEAINVKHYKENECWFNTITDWYKDTLMGEKRREKNRLTKESMLKLMNKTEDDFKTNGASMQDMVPVFEHYGIQVRIFNSFINPIFKYTPTKYNHNIPTLYALAKNNHIYTASDNLQMLRQMVTIRENQDVTVKASPDYHINDKDGPAECKMIYSLNDLKKFKYDLIYNGNDLTELFYQSKMAGYEPQVKFSGCIISELYFKFYIKKKSIKYRVKTQNLITSSIDGTIEVRTEQIYNNMSKAMYEFNKALFNPLHKSYYNEIDMQIFKECRTISPVGEINKFYKVFNQRTNKYDTYGFMPDTTTEIDVRKAYTHAFNQIKEIPVFNQFDIWKKFNYKTHDYSKFHELTLFLVKPKKKALFFNKTHCLVYGMFLKHYADKCDILYYKEPSRVYNVNYRKIANDLWNTNISDHPPEDAKAKKLIANVNFGLLEKCTNKSCKSFAYDSLREALYYQQQVGGKINKISGYGEDNKELDKKFYCLTVSDRVALRNGYTYVKELLLQCHNHKMQEDYNRLINNGVDVWSVKTDAFVIRHDHLNKAKKAIKFDNNIGGWRHENGKRMAPPSEKHKMNESAIPTIPVYENETLDVENEWDTESIAKQITEKIPMIIRSKYAGGGKSHIAKHFSKLGYKTLFVVPQNSISQNIDDEAITTNKFFAIPVGDGEKLPEFDHSKYNCVVFDEIYMNSLYILNRIREFVNQHPDKIIIGAGDVKQLPPIEDLTNTRKPDEYADDCINQIFKHNMMLKICKRLGAKDDPKANENRKTLNNMYNDMWLNCIPVTEFVRKYFKTTDDLMAAEKNIAYTNIRCKNVSNYIRSNLGKTDKYEVGETLICRKYKKVGNIKFNVNYRFKVVNISGNVVTLENIKSKEKYTTDVYTLDNHFRYDYCTTCHSAQGASIKGKITIHEWEKSYLVSREWIWCALTRSTDFNDVMFFEGKTNNSELSEENLHRYLSNKIKNYKLQDEAKK